MPIVELEPRSPHPRGRAIVRLLILLVLSYGAICIGVYLLQARMVFLPSRDLHQDPSRDSLEYEDIYLETGVGERVHGWYVSHQAARAEVLFLHGNAGNIAGRLETIRTLHELGLATLIIDYPGYGKSTGVPAEDACYRAARAALDHLRQRSPGRPLLVWGRSLGGGVATSLLGEGGPRALILESTFTSMPDLAAELYPFLPARLLLHIEFNSAQRLAELSTPLLLIHSRDDDVIPFEHGRRLHAIAGEKATLVPISGPHNGGVFLSGEAYLGPLRDFLDEHFVEGGAQRDL